MAVLEKSELSFFDPDVHSEMTAEEREDMYTAWSDYRDCLKHD